MIDHHIVVGGVIASNRENLWAVGTVFWAVMVSHRSYTCKRNTDFVRNLEVFENIGKSDRKVESRMGACNLDDIKQEANWYAFMLEMYSDCD